MSASGRDVSLADKSFGVRIDAVRGPEELLNHKINVKRVRSISKGYALMVGFLIGIYVLILIKLRITPPSRIT